jgi:hypothetical protein
VVYQVVPYGTGTNNTVRTWYGRVRLDDDQPYKKGAMRKEILRTRGHGFNLTPPQKKTLQDARDLGPRTRNSDTRQQPFQWLMSLRSLASIAARAGQLMTYEIAVFAFLGLLRSSL